MLRMYRIEQSKIGIDPVTTIIPIKYEVQRGTLIRKIDNIWEINVTVYLCSYDFTKLQEPIKIIFSLVFLLNLCFSVLSFRLYDWRPLYHLFVLYCQLQLAPILLILHVYLILHCTHNRNFTLPLFILNKPGLPKFRLQITHYSTRHLFINMSLKE